MKLLFFFTFSFCISVTLAFPDFNPVLPRTSPELPPYYMILTLDSQPLRADLPTRIVVAGEGHEGGEAVVFQESAVSTALKYKELYPADQVVLYFAIEDSLEKERAWIHRWGLREVSSGKNPLGLSEWLNQIQFFQHIQAVHFFTHAWKDFAVIQGEDYLVAWSYWGFLKQRLSENAYVMIHGCNAGWTLAPQLASELGVPVSGALTSTNFEELHSGGNFYFNDASTKPPGPWAKKNDLSFSKPEFCSKGACFRMKPDNHPYIGLHGQLPVGLPYYKFFCPPEKSQACEKIMATAILSFIDLKPFSSTSSEEDLKSLARNWLCPISRNSNIRKDCIQALLHSETNPDDVYSPFRGPLAECDATQCWEPDSKAQPNTFVQEYQTLLRGIHSLVTETKSK